MTTKAVILQPQYFPWGGVFEQVANADIFVHYDDVQFPQGRSFCHRVQVKTEGDVTWMSVPVLRNGLGPINQTEIDYTQPWQRKHIGLLRQSFSKCPFRNNAISIADSVFGQAWGSISELNIAAIEMIAAYFGMKTKFMRSSQMGIGGSSTQRLADICEQLGATTYITGHGAKNYIDYDVFETRGIRVEYMDYQKSPYPQLYGDFTPYVTILDLIANCGRDGVRHLKSGSVYWKDLLAKEAAST